MVSGRTSVRTAARWAVVWIVGLGVLPAGHGAAQIQRVHRDEWQNVEGIVAALELEEGDTVADVGAGEGFLTLRLAERVGPGGKVYAVDIDEAALGELRRAARRASLDNVEIVQSEVDDPLLPPQSVKAVLMVITYHELTEHAAMLAGIERALRPGGRLVILDTPARDPSVSRGQQMARHHMDMAIVEQDLAAAGFAIIRREPTFIEVDDGRHRHRQWMLVAVPADEQRDDRAPALAEGEAVGLPSSQGRAARLN